MLNGTRWSRAKIGAHMSVAGGVSRAVERAVIHGCEAIQIFAKNANRWRARPLDAGEVRRFRRRLDDTGITPAVSHASYLINLATTNPEVRAQSIDAFADELNRAHTLGLLGVVIHPGTCTAGTEDNALRLIASAIRDAFRMRPRRKTMVILEHTAGPYGRISLRAFRGDPRAPGRILAGRCLPRYLPPRRVRLRYRQRARV